MDFSKWKKLPTKILKDGNWKGKTWRQIDRHSGKRVAAHVKNQHFCTF